MMPKKSHNLLKIYPNPATNLIHTTISQFNYSIYDITGRKIEMGKSLDNQINIQHLSPGVYHLELISLDGQHQSTKFIKE